ncbi:MAG: D-alanine--D-alanine ligase [Candidatus Omnitrophica bacterium]|nr:D-alanine--D-alanine ligase [Candidatus Omnitrophota bacterium]
MAELSFGRIGVLMGGPSTEREISLKSGKAVYESLSQAGFEVSAIDIKTDGRDENIKLIESLGIDVAFIALHGRFGEDGQIQEILDTLKIPYTGSGVKASRLAMDKIASRKIFEASGLSVPRYKTEEKVSYDSARERGFNGFVLPLVIKPASHGSSIGLSIIEKEEYLDKALELAFSFDERIIIEEYIRGREVTVGILDEKFLPVIEIIPKKGFFDYEAKYHAGLTDYMVPAELPDEIAARIQEAALSAHKLLGCCGCSRVDLIIDSSNTPFVLEVNTIPGMTATSLLPKAAKVAGIDFSRLCTKLIELAYEKTKIQPPG